MSRLPGSIIAWTFHHVLLKLLCSMNVRMGTFHTGPLKNCTKLSKTHSSCDSSAPLDDDDGFNLDMVDPASNTCLTLLCWQNSLAFYRENQKRPGSILAYWKARRVEYTFLFRGLFTQERGHFWMVYDDGYWHTQTRNEKVWIFISWQKKIGKNNFSIDHLVSFENRKNKLFKKKLEYALVNEAFFWHVI